MGFQNIGLGMNYNPYGQMGIGAAPTNSFSSIGLGASGAATAAPWYMPQLSSGMGGMAGMGQIAGATGTLNNMFTYRNPNQSATGGFMSGALQGATAGSMFGWPGALAGAAIGGFSGKK